MSDLTDSLIFYDIHIHLRIHTISSSIIRVMMTNDAARLQRVHDRSDYSRLDDTA